MSALYPWERPPLRGVDAPDVFFLYRIVELLVWQGHGDVMDTSQGGKRRIMESPPWVRENNDD